MRVVPFKLFSYFKTCKAMHVFGSAASRSSLDVLTVDAPASVGATDTDATV